MVNGLSLGTPDEFFAPSERAFENFIEEPSQFCWMHLKPLGVCSCDYEEVADA